MHYVELKRIFMNKRMFKKRVDRKIDKFLSNFTIILKRARRFRIALKKKPIQIGSNILTLKPTDIGFDLFIDPIIDEFTGLYGMSSRYPSFEIIKKEVDNE